MFHTVRASAYWDKINGIDACALPLSLVVLLSFIYFLLSISLFFSQFSFKQIIIWFLSRFFMFLALWSLKLIEISIFDNFAPMYIENDRFSFLLYILIFRISGVFQSFFLHQTFIYLVKGRISYIFRTYVFGTLNFSSKLTILPYYSIEKAFNTLILQTRAKPSS